MSDNSITRTDSNTAVDLSDVPDVPVLVVAFHPEPGRLGRRCVLAADDALELGRSSPVFGRGALDRDRVSRRHAQIERSGDMVRIRDLDSRNGTRVNGEPVAAIRLMPGDIIGLGPVLLLYAWRPVVGVRRKVGPLVGVSADMNHVAEQIDGVAADDATVLVQGETGVGKELVAAEIHRLSGRRGELVAINCGAVGEGVIQSELFGHVRGAFSGADRDRGGLVAAAAGGTLFLDEIGDASPSLQASLLRLLDLRQYRPVGSDQTLQTDARFVAATHVPLAPAVAAGAFRQDLYARLERRVIHLSPLRDRMEDVVPLALHFARQARGEDVQISRSFALPLLRYRWPNNVRQLRAIIEQAVLEAGGESPLQLTDGVRQRLREEPTHGGAPEGGADAQAATAARAAAGPVVKPSADELRTSMVDHRCNVRAVSRHFGVSRTTMYRWLDEAGIDVAELRRSAS